MSKIIKIISQLIDTKTSTIESESTLHQENLQCPKSMKTLGYNHKAQIKLLQAAQDFKLSHQEKLINQHEFCPKCSKKDRKQGKFTSSFHALFTDHQLEIQRRSCSCGWQSPYTVDGIFGSSLHPDLLERQSLLGAEHSFQVAQKILSHESASQRPINNDDRIKRSVSLVGKSLSDIKVEESFVKIDVTEPELIVTVDGGHLSSKDQNQRSFEALIATVYAPNAVKIIDKHHKKITNKTSVASALEDQQQAIKGLIKHACLHQGMTAETEITALTDGASNCWSVVNSLESQCKKIIRILDWFHIGKKFKEHEHTIPDSEKALYEKIKWHLWHGHPDTALLRLEQLSKVIKTNEVAMTSLNILKRYIDNNKISIVNYHARRLQGKVYTSNVAEMSVNSLINTRQKKNQKMQWSREGAHNILQLRASIFSNTWNKDWDEVQKRVYKEAA